jgi:apolipoprotein D and lipocalin family protein
MATVAQVDLDRFMGDWYLIAHIPTFPEREAYNAIESYALDAKGRVETTFTFHKGGFDGPLKTMTPTGFVQSGTGNAVWGMQFLWPFKAEYRIVYLDDDYEATIIGRSKRDYAWIMARNPGIDETSYRSLVDELVALGYNIDALRRVPHRWPKPGSGTP